MAQLPNGGVRSWLRSRPLTIGACFLAVLLVLGGGSFVIATTSSGVTPGSDGGATEGYDVALVADEDTDPDPLDPETLFDQDGVEVDETTYSQITTDDTDDCAAAAHGNYGEVLTNNDCRQIVRASYLGDENAVTVGVAALPSADAAQEAERGRDIGDSDWFAGLAGPDDSGTERLEYAGGHTSGATWGRYLVFALASDLDGGTPTDEAADLEELSTEFRALPLTTLGERADE